MEEQLDIHDPALSSTQDSTYLSGKVGPSRISEELDLSFLPDELGTEEQPRHHDNTGVMSSLIKECHQQKEDIKINPNFMIQHFSNMV